jgi:acyl transferase domain-containing protein
VIWRWQVGFQFEYLKKRAICTKKGERYRLMVIVAPLMPRLREQRLEMVWAFVVLKRLSEAIADGDCIHAVIKGSAINNDGSRKVGYTAPSVDAQSEAIAEAIMFAEVEPETISYIEAHGTGTALGDPIEITALSKVFRARTEKKAFCAIGSVKTNIGH